MADPRDDRPPTDGSAPAIVPADLEASIARAAAAIRDGHIVAVPTETVYGLACALTDTALDALLEAKGRPATKGITLLVDSIDQVERLAALSEGARRLAERFWPGPLTLVLPRSPGVTLPTLLTGGQAGVGFRLPDHSVPRLLARELGPLPLTSANLSGAPDSRDAATVARTLGERVTLILDDGPSRGGVPSTVVSFVDPGPSPVILRAGALFTADIESALR